MQGTMVCAQHCQPPDATAAEEGGPWATALPIGNMDRHSQQHEHSHHKQQWQVSRIAKPVQCQADLVLTLFENGDSVRQ